jgi:hypothetical protein
MLFEVVIAAWGFLAKSRSCINLFGVLFLADIN